MCENMRSRNMVCVYYLCACPRSARNTSAPLIADDCRHDMILRCRPTTTTATECMPINNLIQNKHVFYCEKRASSVAGLWAPIKHTQPLYPLPRVLTQTLAVCANIARDCASTLTQGSAHTHPCAHIALRPRVKTLRGGYTRTLIHIL